VFEDSGAAKHPGGDLDVHVGHLGAEEKGALLIAGVDEFSDVGLQLLRVLDLLVEFLGLEEVVEGGDDVAVYL
jgi:hypothetical protein